jgi:hypothetical protein
MAQSGYTPLSLYYSATATNVPTAGNLVAGELALNTADGKLFYKDSGGVVQTIAILSRTNGNFGDLTGSITVAKGTTAQQPGTPVTGMLRYNTTTNQFEGYSGASPAWTSVGGATVSNDTTTATNVYPLFASATSGSVTTVYTSNAKYLYKPSTGDLSASQVVASNGIVVNSATVAASYTIATGNNAMSVGPVSVASGQSVTVSSGQRWVIL